MNRALIRTLGPVAVLAMIAWWGSQSIAQPDPVAKPRKNAAGDEPGAALKTFMRAKLHSAQQALEGLCVEDYSRILESAEKLAAMSQAAEWQVIPGPEYVQLSGEFRRSVEQLRKGAKNKDMDVCRLAYLKATLGCLECHDFVRSTRLAALPGLPDLRSQHAIADLSLSKGLAKKQ